MEDDTGSQSDSGTVVIPLSLIQALQAGLLNALDEWQEERGIEEMEADRCFVAMVAAVESTMEFLMAETEGMTLQ